MATSAFYQFTQLKVHLNSILKCKVADEWLVKHLSEDLNLFALFSQQEMVDLVLKRAYSSLLDEDKSGLWSPSVDALMLTKKPVDTPIVFQEEENVLPTDVFGYTLAFLDYGSIVSLQCTSHSGLYFARQSPSPYHRSMFRLGHVNESTKNRLRRPVDLLFTTISENVLYDVLDRLSECAADGDKEIRRGFAKAVMCSPMICRVREVVDDNFLMVIFLGKLCPKLLENEWTNYPLIVRCEWPQMIAKIVATHCSRYIRQDGMVILMDMYQKFDTRGQAVIAKMDLFDSVVATFSTQVRLGALDKYIRANLEWMCISYRYCTQQKLVEIILAFWEWWKQNDTRELKKWFSSQFLQLLFLVGGDPMLGMNMAILEFVDRENVLLLIGKSNCN